MNFNIPSFDERALYVLPVLVGDAVRRARLSKRMLARVYPRCLRFVMQRVRGEREEGEEDDRRGKRTRTRSDSREMKSKREDRPASARGAGGISGRIRRQGDGRREKGEGGRGGRRDPMAPMDG